jgi:hypothetical protein
MRLETVAPGAGVDPVSILKRNKLFIPRFDKPHKYGRNAKVRHSAGARGLHERQNRQMLPKGWSAEEEFVIATFQPKSEIGSPTV